MKYLLILPILILSIFPAQAQEFEREDFYSNQICTDEFNGSPTQLESGLRPDCETAFSVIEFDWAKRPHHYECLGQVIAYAVEINKTPVCVLLARNEKEKLFGEAQHQMFEYARVRLVVWPLYEQ